MRSVTVDENHFGGRAKENDLKDSADLPADLKEIVQEDSKTL